ncbi:MAG: DegV family protein [Ilumatobacteraceae bacterium]|jgi:DegV family protein with EDD domain|nr:DegV family protein [Ilumatobacteraceae bacterium]
MSNVRIVTDSSCDLPAEVVERHRMEIVPLTIRFGEQEYVDRFELSPAEFWAKCATIPGLPETAAPAPGQFEAAYRRLAEEGATGVVVVSLSGALSATMQSAQLAANNVGPELGIPIGVVDSRSVSLGVGLNAIECARRAEAGATVEELVEIGRDVAERTRVFGALDTLENLKRGGRIGNAAALLGTALSIKPLIEVVDGKVEQAGKQRTRTKALNHLIETFRGFEGRVENVAVLHGDCSDVDQFVDRLREHHDGEIVVGELGPVIGTHAGRGTIGFGFHEITR